MSFDARLSPARVSAAAAAAFPRWALFGLLAIYIAAGLFGRDPWYRDDATGFGVMWSMARGEPHGWWLPMVGGDWFAEQGPLPFWVGAALVLTFGPWLGDAQAARLSTVLWFALATTALWYATYRLARRAEAQPVSFAFGGEAEPRDYGRMLADIAVLLLVGTLGIVLRMHETTAETAAFAWLCVALFGLVLALEAPLRGALLAGAATGALALSRGPWPGALLLLAALAVLWLLLREPVRRFAALALLAATAAVMAIWPLGVLSTDLALRDEYFAAWRAWAAQQAGLPAGDELLWFARNLLWYTWPLWPLAAWTLYAWRHALRAPHVALPALVLAAMTAALLFGQANDSALLLLVPPLLLLAAFGATSLRRSLDDLIDWFAIAIFTLFAAAAWVYFIAFTTGSPPRMAFSVARLVPGLQPELRFPALAFAALASAGWLALVAWRIAQRPPMMWRGAALAACGLTMLWLIVVTLFLPAFNYNRSYAPIAAEIRARAERAQPGACIEPYRLNAAHRALLAFHGGLQFSPERALGTCPLLLQRDSRRSQLDDDPPAGDWQLLWEGRWPARPDETLRLYRRGG